MMELPRKSSKQLATFMVEDACLPNKFYCEILPRGYAGKQGIVLADNKMQDMLLQVQDILNLKKAPKSEQILRFNQLVEKTGALDIIKKVAIL